jgi:hypothetical protein
MLKSFALYMNDGTNSNVFTEIDASMIREKPQYTIHTTTAPTVIGATYLFKLQAININGSTYSEPVGFVFADLPETPTFAPTSDLSVSSESQLRIDIQVVAGDGGSPILSYSLEVDDGAGEEFRVLFGTISDTLSTSFTLKNVTRGRVYRARYRVRNAIGFSDYSPIGYLLAASKPSAPPAPIFVAATSSTISIKLGPSLDNHGSVISAYELWADNGDLSSAFAKLESYTGVQTTFTIDQAIETSMVSGRVYRLKYRAVNEIGAGDFSSVTSIAMADKP